MSRTRALADIIARLDACYDFASWHWQADTPPDFVCISAILVQHTSWTNVERALERLQSAGACSVGAIPALPEQELAEIVRPAGMPLVKARRLRAFARLAQERGGLGRLLAIPAQDLRGLLLATNGIGPETADAMILNAAGRPVFQIDAYTTRTFQRLGLGPDNNSYHAWQRWFEEAIPRHAGAYQRYHGLIVLHGKQACRARPRCRACCLLDICPAGKAGSPNNDHL